MVYRKAKNIKQLFERLVSNNQDIKGIILLSYEGLVMVSTFETGFMEEAISAMTAGIASLIPRYLKVLEWKSFSDILITGSKDLKKDRVQEYILIKDVKDIGLLVVFTKSDVDWQKLHSHVRYTISSICFG